MNMLISNLNYECPEEGKVRFGVKISAPGSFKKERDRKALRQSLLEGAEMSFDACRGRCERKFGKGNCIKLGDFSYVYACDKGYAPVWTNPKMKAINCQKPRSIFEMKQWEEVISKKDRKHLTGELNAFFYEILDD